jgi:urea carboxylase
LAIEEVAATIAVALDGVIEGPAWDVELALTDDAVHIDMVTGVDPATQSHAQPDSQSELEASCQLLVHVYATDTALVQGWRCLDAPDVPITDGLTLEITPTVAAGADVVAGDHLAVMSIVAPDRALAVAAAATALLDLRCDGPADNRVALLRMLRDAGWSSGHVVPTLAVTANVFGEAVDLGDEITEVGTSLRIERPGIQTTVQDAAGRQGFWEIGVPPSGPMDDLSLRLANEAVGNAPDLAGLEITLGGFVATATQPCTVAVAGAPSDVTIDGRLISAYEPVDLAAGSRIEIPPPKTGLRIYLAVRGGIDTSMYLGSRATFTLGGFGGFRGRELQRGDVLPIGETKNQTAGGSIAVESRPQIGTHWEIGVRLGPHTDPDFITSAGIKEFFAATWKVSPQSNRTGVRLLGPKPQWAREDGGDAGLHPSNIHDNAYAFGAIDLTGDLPVVLGPDGPSLGGFVCPGVVVSGQRWKLGQAKPGDTVQWVVLDAAAAMDLRSQPASSPQASDFDRPEIMQQAALPEHPGRCLRRQGDEFLLLEFGPMELELGLRLRVQALYERLQASCEPGVIDLVPGIRSLQVHYNPDRISEARLSEILLQLDDELGDARDLVVPSRQVRLPLSWDDPSTRKAIDIYMRTVNPDAPWCPWNIEFIRRINGLDSVDEVHRTVFESNYLVYGLGDVYLGAPVATPLDPRHRLVTTKYNPARTWTPENAVGIGGGYMCIYGMEGPGGYQFVGRTVQVWNAYPTAPCFADGQPWLLRQFDRLQFYSVSADELTSLRKRFPAGTWQPEIDSGQLSLAEQYEFQQQHAAEIATVKARQQAAFQAERRRWAEQ